jgi:elongation factor G
MKAYDSEHIRNIALVGHQGAGKTILAEAMLYSAGVLNRMGQIGAGSTVSDYHPSEIEREMSIFASMVHVEWDDVKINVLDTPGYPDFLGEVVSSLSAAEAAIFVINGADGVQVGTEIAWQTAEDLGIPSMFVINHLDRADASFETVVSQIQDRFGRAATVVQMPGGAGSRSIVDVLVMKQLTYPTGSKRGETSEISADFADRAEALHNELIESIAENDESLMDLYFEKGTLSEDEMRTGLRGAMAQRDLFPIFLSSATENIGVSRLLDFVHNVSPSPVIANPPATVEGELKVGPSEKPVALVFKTLAEHHVGEYSFLKVVSGTLTPGIDLENAQNNGTERLNQLFSINGKERENAPNLTAGDIGAVVKLRNTHTNDTLRQKGSNVIITPIGFPEPRYQIAVRPVHQGEEDRLAQGLHQLQEEDPSLIVTHDAHLNQILMAGQGETHLEIARYRLKTRFNVEVEFYKPRISYRETVTKEGHAQYRHKKQTGGAGQFADITLYVEPLNGPYEAPSNINVRNTHEATTGWGSKVEYIDAIVGGVIDMRRFFGAIQKGVTEMLKAGPLAGYPVGDIRVVIYDGGMHSVDSNDNAFRSAAMMGFRRAFAEASPVMLEPVHNLEVLVPETYMGDVLGDLNTRRARIQGMGAEGPFQKILAQVPEAELYRYSTALRSLTQGRGIHKSAFHAYEAVPRHVQEKIIEESAAENEE